MPQQKDAIQKCTSKIIKKMGEREFKKEFENEK
jgi:hypothetical protein